MTFTSDFGLISRAQQFMDRFAASRAERSSRRQHLALQLMDPRLLDDIGIDSIDISRDGKPLARLNPLVVAVSLYTTPRGGR